MEPVLLERPLKWIWEAINGVSCTHLSLDGILPFDLRTVLRYQDLHVDLKVVREIL